jgi:hypothetical protein
MTWEHIFAFARDGYVYRDEPIYGSQAVNSPKLPMPVPQYVFELGRSDGYQFAGSYPKDDGFVIVLKRERGPEV